MPKNFLNKKNIYLALVVSIWLCFGYFFFGVELLNYLKSDILFLGKNIYFARLITIYSSLSIPLCIYLFWIHTHGFNLRRITFWIILIGISLSFLLGKADSPYYSHKFHVFNTSTKPESILISSIYPLDKDLEYEVPPNTEIQFGVYGKIEESSISPVLRIWKSEEIKSGKYFYSQKLDELFKEIDMGTRVIIQ